MNEKVYRFRWKILLWTGVIFMDDESIRKIEFLKLSFRIRNYVIEIVRNTVYDASVIFGR